MSINNYGPSLADLGWSIADCYEEYPPCKMCNGPNDVGEVCLPCSKDNDPFNGDTEASGGWMIQGGDRE